MTHTFDPAKCDHGAELHGTAEWTWCANCDPARARDLCFLAGCSGCENCEPKCATPTPGQTPGAKGTER